jgi:hypothetical protein
MLLKKWYLSKTLWVNFVMFLGVVVMEATGQDLLDTATQAEIIIAVNAILRLVTKEELVI